MNQLNKSHNLTEKPLLAIYLTVDFGNGKIKNSRVSSPEALDKVYQGSIWRGPIKDHSFVEMKSNISGFDYTLTGISEI